MLTVDGGTFRFRHMLTREAVIAELLPPKRVAPAARALAALEAAHPGLPGASGDLAADLAVQADNPEQAGVLLTESGRSALARGALATATGRCAGPRGCSPRRIGAPRPNPCLSRHWRWPGRWTRRCRSATASSPASRWEETPPGGRRST